MLLLEQMLKSGSAGKCIEGRELIIALPEAYCDFNKLTELYFCMKNDIIVGNMFTGVQENMAERLDAERSDGNE